jgi:enterochelin esterase-like enzyme
VVGSLRVEDPEPRYAAVRLRSDLPLGEPDFLRDDGGWVLHLPQARLARLEYQLELLGHDGTCHVVCDPGNPQRAPGPFGEKSVVVAPGYRPPDWLEGRRTAGTIQAIAMRVLGYDLEVRIWSPGEGELPLLVAHDGPEYDALACLTRYAGAMIERGALPPFRIALLPPGHRDEWYSASAAYSRALCGRILPALRDQIAVAGRPVGMGPSLGALAMLHAQRTWPATFAGLFLQSGSFFVPRFDRHESGFPRYRRIVRFVRGVLGATADEDPVPITMTCAGAEENVHNNRLIAAALSGQGYPVELAELPGGHDFESWRGGLHPHLTRLLSNLWPAR